MEELGVLEEVNAVEDDAELEYEVECRTLCAQNSEKRVNVVNLRRRETNDNHDTTSLDIRRICKYSSADSITYEMPAT